MQNLSRLVFHTWQKVYQYYQKRHFDHNSNSLDIDNLMIILNNKSEIESLDKKNKNLNAGDI